MTEHHPTPERPSITLGPAAGSLRRSLGAQAWCALECLAARATTGSDGTIVAASVRAVAAELGVAKNTAHRALAVLVAAGLASQEQRRRADGTFEAGAYRLDLGEAITPVADEPHPQPATSAGRDGDPEPTPVLPLSATPRRARRASQATGDQLSLLDA